MNHYAMQRNALAASCEHIAAGDRKNQVICPKPRRLGPLGALPSPDSTRPLRWQTRYFFLPFYPVKNFPFLISSSLLLFVQPTGGLLWFQACRRVLRSSSPEGRGFFIHVSAVLLRLPAYPSREPGGSRLPFRREPGSRSAFFAGTGNSRRRWCIPYVPTQLRQLRSDKGWLKSSSGTDRRL